MTGNKTDEVLNLWKGESIELLKALHIVTRDGKMNLDSRRKLKQVHHLSQLIEPYIRSLDKKAAEQATSPVHAESASAATWTLADLGAGKSYLGFILYDLVVRHLPIGRILAIEARPELTETAKRLAQTAGFDRMKFVAAKIDSPVETAGVPEKIEIVTALHACDTATDDAIRFGLTRGARLFALVPCCQAEVARLLEPLVRVAAPDDRALFEFPLHRREFGSHLTNVIRVLYLKSQGYRVTVTELVGWEHSMKNELILAEKISDPEHAESKRARMELDQLLGRFKVKPKLLS